MSLLLFIAVGCGGALGALCRSKGTALLKKRFNGLFPFATLIINICSCTIAGLLLAFETQLDSTAYLAITVGFLGGFSTLSTMNFEAVDLIKRGYTLMGIVYLVVTYASTLGAASIGFALVKLASIL